MKILYYDCFAGISGDMNLAAMIDLGVEQDHLVSELKKLNISGYELRFSRQKKNAIEGTKVDVILTDHGKEYSHSHGDHGHHHATPGHAENRNLEDIRKIIEDSLLSDAVKSNSMRIFSLIAEAEAKVHGTTIDKVHFHEVGAVDSIVDVVGAAICFDYLDVDRIVSTPIELGGGFVKCQHGLIPVPAPATLEILNEIPIKMGAVNHEATTPTGAAILAAMADRFCTNMDFTIEKIGLGVGTRDVEIPNILRVFLCRDDKSKSKSQCDGSQAVVFESNIDDMNPELYEYVMERLLASGAKDVYMVPVLMKKTRPGTILKVLCSVENQDAVLKVLLTETTTLGVRKYVVDKICLDRTFKQIVTKYGSFTLKFGLLDGKAIKCKPEYEECKRAALEHDVAIHEIYREISGTNHYE